MSRRIRLVTGAIGCVLVVLLVYGLFQLRHFRVVSTNPGQDSVAAVSPFFKISFNKQLAAKNLSVSSSYSVVTSYSVHGKTLTAELNSPMTAGYKYIITINSISDTGGDTIKNKVFVFTPKDVAWQNLPQDQQQALLQAQAKRTKTVYDIDFVGTDALTNVGVTGTQLGVIEQEFFNFNQSVNTVSIDQGSVAPEHHDPNSSSTTESVDFTVRVGSTNYKATINYTNLGNDARLQLYNSKTGAPVFDSSTPPKKSSDF